MIRHIVMWKYNNNLSLEERANLFEKLEKAAENMKGRVDGLIDITLFSNKNPKEKYDLCLYCEFETLEAVDLYQEHPLHIVFKELIIGNVIDRVCIDG